MSEIKIKTLRKKILKARQDYYNGEAAVTDQLFDAWIDELTLLDPTNYAITGVGAPIVSEWKKVEHKIPMGSLDKCNDEEGLQKWYKVKKKVVLSEKLDGISINCIYKDGAFVQALTRGDGSIGEDIFSNVNRMIGVPKTIDNFNGSIRGEIVLTKSLYEQHFTDKKNTRNAASGVSKRLDGVGCEHLTVMFYMAEGDVDFDDEVSKFIWLRENKCLTPKFHLVDDVEAAMADYSLYQSGIRDDLDYDIDGLVFTFNDIVYGESLGVISQKPKKSIALKFDNVMVQSKLLNVEWQVGNSGRITPVGHVDPIILVGVEVEKASLYNIAYINKLNLTIGATVLVTRANDVIPRVEQVVQGTNVAIEIPTSCPECNSALELDGENLMCRNAESCPAQIIGRLENWVKNLNFLEWGESLLTKLVETDLVKDVADLYTLTLDDLSNLKRMGDKSAQNCLDTLHANKSIPLYILIGSLTIANNGRSTAKTIVESGIDTIDKFLSATVDDFASVDGMGEIKSQYLVDGLVRNTSLIKRLLENGVSIKQEVQGKLTGLKFCFSGKFRTKRSILEQRVIDAGGSIGSVGKGLTYLALEDPNSTSGKAQKARKFGVEIISEDQFLEML